MRLTRRLPVLRERNESGFTLVELVMTIAIVGVIVAGLAGVVMSYLKTTVATQARLTQSHDVQFAAAYWQRDVASIGLHADYVKATHSFPLKQSVNTTPSCALPAAPLITMAWNQFDQPDKPDVTSTITVSYVAQAVGSVYQLTRIRCTGSTVNSSVLVARNLTSAPTVTCTGGGVSGCSDTSGAVPTTITMSLTATSADSPTQPTYTATLSGERRQT